MNQSIDSIYFSAILKDRHPVLFKQIIDIIVKYQKNYVCLEQTKDIWCRDYMPIRTYSGKFIGFDYDPNYLKPVHYHQLRTDQKKVFEGLGLDVIYSNIVLDGGNVVMNDKTAVLTDKIFSENNCIDPDELIEQLSSLLEVQKIVILPKEPYDYLGHTDGICRFLDDGSLLVADFSHHSRTYQKKLSKALDECGLRIIHMPPLITKTWDLLPHNNAIGCYINFLRIHNLIITPEFGIEEDEMMIDFIRRSYPECTVESVMARHIAEEGGVLNCISWPYLEVSEIGKPRSNYKIIKQESPDAELAPAFDNDTDEEYKGYK